MQKVHVASAGLPLGHCLTHFSWDLQGGHGTEIVTGTYHPHHIPVHIVGMPAFIANFREESEITK